jgi:hypothetical protein
LRRKSGMTDRDDPDGLPDEAREERRRVIEDTLLAFHPEVVDQFREQIGREVSAPREALDQLADADVPRLLKHRLLIHGVRRLRDQGPREELEEPARRVLDSTMEEAPAEEASARLSRVDEAKRHLDAVAAADGEPQLRAEDWERWVGLTDGLFQFSTEERTFQACNDEVMVDKARSDHRLVMSRLIVAEFWSDQPPAAFSTYIDPLNWPTCSVFWRAMTVLGTKTPTDTGYDCDVRETVAILSETLVVPLQVAFRTRPDRSRVWTRFNIARPYYDPSVPVDVDTGTVSAESMTGGPARTLVRATKYLHWSDPTRPDFTMLACDFGWCELMVEMAYGCVAGFPSRTTPATETTSVDDAIKQFVEDVTTECRESIGDYKPSLEKLIGRFTGPSWDPRWINDLLAMGTCTTVRYGRIASHIRRFADALKDVDREGDHA